jgi:hypothetical protein
VRPIRFIMQFLSRSAASFSDALQIGTIVAANYSTLYWIAIGLGLLSANWFATKEESSREASNTDQDLTNEAVRLLNLIRAGNHLATDTISSIEKLPLSVQLREIDKVISGLSINDEIRSALYFYRILKSIEQQGVENNTQARTVLGRELQSLAKTVAANNHMIENVVLRMDASRYGSQITEALVKDATREEQSMLRTILSEIREIDRQLLSREKFVDLQNACSRLEQSLALLPDAIVDRVVEKISPRLQNLIICNWFGTDVEQAESLLDRITRQRRQRSAIMRQVTDIAERIAELITPSVELEAEHKEGELVDDTLERLQQELSGRDNKSELAREILDLVNLVVGNFPTVDKITAEELLAEDAALLGSCRDTLEKAKRIHASGRTGTTEDDYIQFERRYCTSIASSMDVVELFGMDVPEALGRRYRLSVAYITLDVSFEETELTVASALAESSRLLIRGDPGSGKTTILQWIAVQAAGKNTSAQLELYEGKIPFFIRLRDVDIKKLGHPDVFFSSSVSHLAHSAPKGWLRSTFESGAAIFLIDGVDEVPAPERLIVREWVHGLVNSYPESAFVITSRPLAAGHDWLEDVNFDTAELRNLQPLGIKQLVTNWYQAASDVERDETSKLELLRAADDLYAKIAADQSLRKLASSPLLCAMLCAFHRSSRGVLPEDKSDLYEKSVNILLDSRDRERRILNSDYPAMTLKMKRLFVEDLAYWCMDNQYVTATSSSVCERIDFKLSSMAIGECDLSSEGILKFFLERSHLLHSVTRGSIEFSHRTFQEFLAARECLKQRNIGKLISNAKDDQWTQTIVLFSGLCGRYDRDELVSGLLDLADKCEADEAAKIFLLALESASADVEKVSSALEARLLNCLEGVLPPTTFSAASRLAACGPRVLPHLKYNSQSSSTINAACIRAIGLIGGDYAVDLLKSYCQSPSIRESFELTQIALSENFDAPMVRRELPLLALPSFADVAKVSRTYWHEERTFSEVYVGSADGISDERVSYLLTLGMKSLTIRIADKVTDIKQFGALGALRELKILSAKRLNSIDFLVHATELESLKIQHARCLQSLAVIPDMKTLKALTLTDARSLVDIRPLLHAKLIEISIDGLSRETFIPELLIPFIRREV